MGACQLWVPCMLCLLRELARGNVSLCSKMWGSDGWRGFPGLVLCYHVLSHHSVPVHLTTALCPRRLCSVTPLLQSLPWEMPRAAQHAPSTAHSPSRCLPSYWAPSMAGGEVHGPAMHSMHDKLDWVEKFIVAGRSVSRAAREEHERCAALRRARRVWWA